MNKEICRAFVFPGQGSQYVGMGHDLYEAFPEARSVFEEVSDLVKMDLKKIIFAGPLELLSQTQYTQPALMTVSIAIIKVLEKQIGSNLNDLGKYAAGHSLGEYSALCAAGSLSLADTAKLLKIRGESMQKACKPGIGGMAAILNMPIVKLDVLINNAQKIGLKCQIANDNSDSQLVISGEIIAINKIVAQVNDLGFRAVKLNVSAPFHSSFMQPVTHIMADALKDIEINSPTLKFIANVNAKELSSHHDIREALTQQVEGNVLWRQSIDYMINKGVNEIIEVGAGKVLTNLLKRSNKVVNLINLEKISDIDAFCKQL